MTEKCDVKLQPIQSKSQPAGCTLLPLWGAVGQPDHFHLQEGQQDILGQQRQQYHHAVAFHQLQIHPVQDVQLCGVVHTGRVDQLGHWEKLGNQVLQAEAYLGGWEVVAVNSRLGAVLEVLLLPVVDSLGCCQLDEQWALGLLLEQSVIQLVQTLRHHSVSRSRPPEAITQGITQRRCRDKCGHDKHGKY